MRRLIAVMLVTMLAGTSSASGTTLDKLSTSDNVVLNSLTDSGGKTFRDEFSYVWWERLRSGEAPWDGTLVFYFGALVGAFEYAFSVDVVAPTGRTVSAPVSVNEVEPQLGQTCYLPKCHGYLGVASLSLPVGTEPGEYLLRINAYWTGSRCVGTVCETNIPMSHSVTYARALVLLSADSGAAPQASPAAPQAQYLNKQATFTATALSSWDAAQFRVTGYEWQMVSTDGTIIKRLFAAAIDPNGVSYTHLQWQLSGLPPGFSVSVRIAAVNSHGIGNPSLTSVFSVPVAAPVVKKTVKRVVCQKGKVKKTLVGKRCPAHWKIARRIYG